MEKDELQKEIVEMQEEVSRIRALTANENFLWYIDKLKQRKEYLKNVLATDTELTTSKDVSAVLHKLRLIQAEIALIDRLVENPFIIIELDDINKELEEEEKEGETEE